MSQVTSWVLTICGGVLICGLISVLIPNASLEKSMNLVLGLFLLCCFLLPAGLDFSDLSWDLDLPVDQMEQMAEETQDFFLQSALDRSEEEAAAIIYKQMKDYGIKENEIQIYIKSEAQSPDGEEELVVEVILPERVQEYHDIIHKALEYELGVSVRLGYQEEEP